ncbi:hypothetical protein A2V71_04135 [Candidatus Berkelbacteria bacterium RBG_13_40_8]|uniref:L,D-TPase catalytic domain-containing protein n=1 Tax=Candidatus Berkelbacteria bacterium RBG_13_40_8 TaxID=1797467 RepID=A0A1F5DP21_9BACT|nr:MAG: hypothetical protein A2V71_04135 [Candidatus Berkelbacteria bacterium RBG_13_40_8]
MKKVLIVLAALLIFGTIPAISAEDPENSPSTLQTIPADPEEEPNNIQVGITPQDSKVVPPFSFTFEPLEVNGRLLVPIREVADRIGAKIYLEEKNFFLERENIRFKIPEDLLKIGDITFIPVILLRDLLKLTIDYDKKWEYLGIGESYWKLSKVKRIIIDIADQRLYCFEGPKLVYETHTVTGDKKHSTRTGVFKIYKKIPGKHIVTGVPWTGVMYNPLYYSGMAAIHGSTSMPSHPASHGCCRVSIKKVDKQPSPSEWLYAWGDIGTTIIVLNKF